MDPDGTDEGETRRDEADHLGTALGIVQRCPPLPIYKRGRRRGGRAAAAGGSPARHAVGRVRLRGAGCALRAARMRSLSQGRVGKGGRPEEYVGLFDGP